MPRDLDIAAHLELDDDERPEAGLVALMHCIFFVLACLTVTAAFEQEAQQKEAQHKEAQQKEVQQKEARRLPIALPRCGLVQPALRQGQAAASTEAGSRPAGAGVLSLNSHKSLMTQFQHLGLRATQV